MASTSVSSKNCNLVEQYCSITGASEEKATKMLEVCSWNLEMAVNMHVDSDFPDEESNNVPNNPNDVKEELPIRAPIPQSREILVEENYSFHYNYSRPKRPSRSIFDGFRDIEAETEWQEMELGARPTEGEGDLQKRRKTLEDLYRPPLDLMHRGSFESARELGKSCNKWLMVNIHDSLEFACQLLNRDVWSNPAVKSIISQNFIFWQVHRNSEEGERYMQFYNPVTFPYVSVIDPRTGENLVVWNKLDSMTFCDLVSTFLGEQAVPDGSIPATKSFHVASILDDTEEQQIKAAVEASLKEMASTQDDEDDGSDIETFDSDSESQHAKSIENNFVDSSIEDSFFAKDSDWEKYLGSKDDETTDLVLRLPNGNREKITWPCTSKIKALILYAGMLGYKDTKYELVTNFPRKNIGRLPLDKTLKEMGLYPREMVFVQLKSSSP